MVTPLYTRDQSIGRWSERLLVAMAICTAAGILYGAIRGYNGAFHGISGMFLGGFSGYFVCRISGENSLDRYFSTRVWLALSGAAVYMFSALIVTGLLVSSTVDSPFYWIDRMIWGYGKESFFSIGRTGPVFKAYSGVLQGGWWLFFSLLDGALFAFTFLSGYVCGFKRKSQPSGSRDRTEKTEDISNLAVKKSKKPMISFVLVISCIWGIYYTGRVFFEESRISYAVLSEYAGEWAVKESNSIPFSSDGKRAFVIRPGAMGDLYGESRENKLFSFSLSSKGLFDRRFSGTFMSADLPFSFSHVRAVFDNQKVDHPDNRIVYHPSL